MTKENTEDTLRDRVEDTRGRCFECIEQGGSQMFVDTDVLDILLANEMAESDLDASEQINELGAKIISLEDRLKEATENLAQYQETFAADVEAGIQATLDTVKE